MVDFWGYFVNSGNVFKNIFKALFKYPVMFLPIIANIIIFSLISIYFRFHFDTSGITSLEQFFGFGFLVLMLLCFIISFNCFVLLEIIQQIENGKPINLFSALDEVIFKDIPRALPIMLVWAIIWFILEVINMIISSLRSRRRRGENRGYARRYGNDMFLRTLSTIVSLVESGVRMLIFYVYPAIAWEDASPIESIKKSFRHLKEVGPEFLIGFGELEFISAIVGVPLLLFLIANEHVKSLPPETLWTIIIIYMSIAFSFYIFLQQIYTAILYLWIIKWNKAVVIAIVNKQPIPTIKDVEFPSLVDDNFDLCISNRKL